MILRVDPTSATPVYEQIRVQVRRMVAAGTLKPESKLPTIRQLASDLKLSKGTISKAYELLERDQLLEAHGRKGTFIAANSQPHTIHTAETLLAAAEELAITAKQMNISKGEMIQAAETAWDNFTDHG